MLINAQDRYLNTQVKTASPGELTLLLYNGCIKFLKTSISCMGRNDIEGKHQNLVKAQNIIEELQSTLNMDIDISRNLYSIYDYIQFRLNESFIKQSEEPLNESISLLTDLRETWVEALKLVRKGDGGV